MKRSKEHRRRRERRWISFLVASARSLLLLNSICPNISNGTTTRSISNWWRTTRTAHCKQRRSQTSTTLRTNHRPDSGDLLGPPTGAGVSLRKDLLADLAADHQKTKNPSSRTKFRSRALSPGSPPLTLLIQLIQQYHREQTAHHLRNRLCLHTSVVSA